MTEQLSFFNNHKVPFAERMRPQTLGDIVGQEHLLAKGKLFRQAIENDTFGSCIFWGPPGSGKTTIAHVIAHVTKRDFVAFNAAFNGIKEVKAIIEQAEKSLRYGGKNTILFVDEIHRFNKAQQDAFLRPIEKGFILLIGATTENPSFEINSALLSRCAVYRLQQLEQEHLEHIAERALEHDQLKERHVVLESEARDLLINYANGDARVVLNTLEIAAQTTQPNEKGQRLLTLQVVKESISSRRIAYDKKGEEFYNLISALHKSMRGSDPQASLYWLARMIEGGADPLYIARRLVRFASEDIGLADPQALVQTLAAKDTVDFLGFPEGDVALAQAVVYLATAPKSNSLYVAMSQAKHDVREKPNEPVPLHICNAPTKMMKNFGYGAGYAYDHQTPEHYSGQTFFPDGMGEPVYYQPGQFGFEKEIAKRLEYWKKLKERLHSGE